MTFEDWQGRTTDPTCGHSWSTQTTAFDYSDYGPKVITAYCKLCRALITFERKQKEAPSP